MLKKGFKYFILAYIVFFVILVLRLRYVTKNNAEKPSPVTEVQKYPSYKIENTSKYKTNREFLIDIILPHHFNGKIRSKYIEEMNHDDKCLIIVTRNYYFDLHIRADFEGCDSGLFEFAREGDSIFKNSGSLIISIKRGVIIKNFNVTLLKEYWKAPYYNESPKESH
ncbi:MAG: hypothetical protein NTU44_16525 [Bacteroidetes bacterium]|nr:hypothetical protein [Bacteroidota bacterium]